MRLGNPFVRTSRDASTGRRSAAKLLRTLVVICLVAGPLGAWPAAAFAAGTTSRVSVSSGGTEGNGLSGIQGATAVTPDGRYLTFFSSASNLVAGDTNGAYDVFVRDTFANSTTLVSVDSAGGQGDGPSQTGSISGNARYVAFMSLSTNLVPGDTNGMEDVFVRDTVLGTTTRVSVDSSGAEGNAGSWQPSISADGRYIAFTSNSSNLVPGDTNGAMDIFVHDMNTGATGRVSVDSSGGETNSLGHSSEPCISTDGRYVAFYSQATNLVAGDTNGMTDVFVRDTLTGTTTRASVSSSGGQANSDSTIPFISSGRYVVFESGASNLVVGDTNSATDTFVRDLQAGTTVRVSVSTAGVEGDWGTYPGATISADGRYVAFCSGASNLVPLDVGGKDRDVFVRDLQAGTTTLMSADSSGVQGNSDSTSPHITANGLYVVFASIATNLVAGDTNAFSDVFFRDYAPAAPPSVTTTPASSWTGILLASLAGAGGIVLYRRRRQLPA